MLSKTSLASLPDNRMMRSVFNYSDKDTTRNHHRGQGGVGSIGNMSDSSGTCNQRCSQDECSLPAAPTLGVVLPPPIAWLRGLFRQQYSEGGTTNDVYEEFDYRALHRESCAYQDFDHRALHRSSCVYQEFGHRECRRGCCGTGEPWYRSLCCCIPRFAPWPPEQPEEARPGCERGGA